MAESASPTAGLFRSLPAASGTLALGAVLSVVAGLIVTGAATSSLLIDPGFAVRWGLPVVRAIGNVAAALTIGLLVMAAVILAPGGVPRPTARSGDAKSTATLGGLTLSVVRLAGGAALVWLVTGLGVLVLSYAQVGGPPSEPGFAQQLAASLPQFDLLRALLVSAVVVSVVATGALIATRHTTVGWMASLSLLALLPIALTGHASGSRDHELAVNSLAMHLLGVTVWVGGLAGLVLMRRYLGDQASPVAQRYSRIAGWCFALTVLSGVLNAMVRLGSWSGLGTRYGTLVMVKVLAVAMLGLAGAAHRRLLLSRLTAGAGAAFWRLVAGELLVMGIALGTGSALADSHPPAPPLTSSSAALALTGYELPPPLHAELWLTAWRLDLLWATVALVLAGLYLAGVLRLRRRGDRWPVLRTLCWLMGCLMLVWATNGAPGIYGRVLFSAHMGGHMVMSMVVPPLLVLGGPVTLALRALVRRHDGSRGPREWLLLVVHSRVLTLMGNPLVAAAFFTGSLVAFYFSPLFELSLRTHSGHVLMHAHFLLAGYLFASVLIGVDPGPRRPPYPLRLVLLFITMAFHAFFGIALVQGTRLLAPDVLGVLGRTWGRSPLADQRYGGGVAWAVGEAPTLLLGLGIAVAWVIADSRDTRRTDRQADRDGDAELAAYNADLARRAEHSQRGPR